MRVFFEEESDSISIEDITFLHCIARNLRFYQKFQITVVGHIAVRGIINHQSLLVKKRVNAIIQLLRDLGIPNTRIQCQILTNDVDLMDSCKLLFFKA